MNTLPCPVTNKYLVWWTDVEACRWLGNRLPASFPDYLAFEWRQRIGIPGEGRLWLPDHVDPGELVATLAAQPGLDRSRNPTIEQQLAWTITRTCAGIVFDIGDVDHVTGLPGFICRLDMTFWAPGRLATDTGSHTG